MAISQHLTLQCYLESWGIVPFSRFVRVTGVLKNSPARTMDNKQRSLQAFLCNKSFVHSTFNGHSPRSPITDHQSPITNHRSPITNHRSPIADHRSPIADHRTHRHGIRDLGIKRSSIRDKPTVFQLFALQTEQVHIRF